MADMIGIKERDQNIDVEQRAHSVRILFSEAVDLLICDDTASALERHEACDCLPGTDRLGVDGCECTAGQLGQNGACRSIRPSREALGCLQNVIVDFQSGTHRGPH
jgi:hypothetical protein